jgi:transcription initiation factor TFIID subunit 9B
MDDAEAGPASPRDAKTIAAILHAMGVEDYDERVVHQLLELLYRHVWSVLDDARVYSEHADKTAIDVDDVKLAIRTRVDTSFTQPPSRDVAMRLAKVINAEPLPPVDSRAGVSLPPPELQLTKQNFVVVLPDLSQHQKPISRTPQ